MGEYVPKLTLRTYRNDNNITIESQNNGPGIPEKIKDKILQAVFNTKKGPDGTGLGLISLTNTIINIKAPRGLLTIESKENECTCFSIHLIINQ